MDKLSFHNFINRLKLFFCHRYKILVVIFILITNYFLFNAVYVNIFLHVGKPSTIGDVQGSTKPVSFYFDKFEETRVNGQETYQLIGWAFPKDLTQPLAEYRKQVVLINEHSKGYYFDTEVMPRIDVTAFYKDLGVNLDQSGFYVNISKFTLPKGRYTVALLFSLPDGSEPILYRTDTYLVRTANHLDLSH